MTNVFTDDHRTETMAERRQRRLERQRQLRRIWEEGIRVELTCADLRRGDWLLEVPAQFGRRHRHFGGKITKLRDGYWGVAITVEGSTEQVKVATHFTCVVMKERLVVDPRDVRCWVCVGIGAIKPCSCPRSDDDEVCDCPYVPCPAPGCAHR